MHPKTSIKSARKKYKSRDQSVGSSSTTDQLEFESDEDGEPQKLTLDAWDLWFGSSDDLDIPSDSD